MVCPCKCRIARTSLRLLGQISDKRVFRDAPYICHIIVGRKPMGRVRDCTRVPSVSWSLGLVDMDGGHICDRVSRVSWVRGYVLTPMGDQVQGTGASPRAA